MLTTEVWNIICNSLTINCIRYPALSLVHWGSMDPLRKHFPTGILKIILILYIFTLITAIFQWKNIKYLYRFQMAAKWPIFILRHFEFRGKFSSVASPICQEGQSERTFPILAFSSRFILFVTIFPNFCSLFSRFLPLFPDFDKFPLSRGALCPLASILATPLGKFENALSQKNLLIKFGSN